MVGGHHVNEIDGSVLEGGGQILRIGAALSVLSGRRSHFFSIRSKRSTPGLRAQHLEGLRLAARLAQDPSDTTVVGGGRVGCTELWFEPGRGIETEDPGGKYESQARSSVIHAGTYIADPGTAGSTALLAQVSVPPACFSAGPCTLVLRGGTNATMAPQMDYIQLVLAPTLARMGAKVDVDIRRRGFFPQGGGEVVVTTHPAELPLQPLELTDPGTLVAVRGFAFGAGNIPGRVTSEIIHAALDTLSSSIAACDHERQDRGDLGTGLPTSGGGNGRGKGRGGGRGGRKRGGRRSGTQARDGGGSEADHAGEKHDQPQEKHDQPQEKKHDQPREKHGEEQQQEEQQQQQQRKRVRGVEDGSPADAAHRSESRCSLTTRGGVSIDVGAVHFAPQEATGTGGGLILVAETSTGCLLGGSALAERGVRAAEVGRRAAAEIAAAINGGGCLDEYLTDQVIVFMALARGVSRIRTCIVSLHTETAMHYCASITGAKFEVAEDSAMPGTKIITCTGAGWTRDWRGD